MELFAGMAADWSAGRLDGDWSCSATPEVLVDDALFGLGVDFFRLLMAEGVLRVARAFPFGKP